MIIYGSRSKQLVKETSIEKCAHCGNRNMDIYIFQKYAHIFWIPFFPFSKTGVSQCNNCKQVLKQNEMPASLQKETYDILKLKTATPVWMFSGLALLVLLITSMVIDSNKKNERNALLILAPQSGDVFEVRTKDNQYTLFKVDDVQGDTVLFFINDFQTNKSSGLRDIKEKGDNAYAKETYVMARQELKEMFDKGDIVDIDRK
ncbi:MAG TPA: hypothetical protein VM012_11445 [Flavitalea sp.]|nr:hypothetical protein [Flavitalea sp.]